VGADCLERQWVEPAQVHDPRAQVVLVGQLSGGLQAQPIAVGVADQQQVGITLGPAA